MFVETPGLLVDKKVRRRRPARTVQSHPVDPFADRASRISRYLLKHPPGQSWGVRELSSIAQVSLGTTSKIVRALEERDLVVVTRQGRSAAVSLIRPRELFKSWTSVYDWSRNPALTVQAPVGDPKEFIRALPRKLPSASTAWAATLHAGAALIAPHATWNQIHLYVNVPTATLLERFSADLNWRPAPDGRVTLMRPYYRESLWRDVHRHAGIPVVDTLQLALDLWNYPARGREQAEYILRRELPWILDDLD
ncbi:MAG: type IV toxin-antitoxin system AbiEi family antitoxin [Gemmatimonadota bacterium]|nr:type IV toxin-antitoxin system AbiEi family antitoxin [Gemmatimonadota bacterium]